MFNREVAEDWTEALLCRIPTGRVDGNIRQKIAIGKLSKGLT